MVVKENRSEGASVQKALVGPPPLRSQICLNGDWVFNPVSVVSQASLSQASGTSRAVAPRIKVPEFWDAVGFRGVSEAIYERSVTVPAEWAGKIIKLEFDGVNQIANVYINDGARDTLVGQHVGGWVPFSFDITELVTPGSQFTLKVHVKGGSYPPILVGNLPPEYPVGWYGHEQQWGIIFDVWLRAYGVVHVQDAFIQTSYENIARGQDSLIIDYMLENSDPMQAQTVRIEAKVALQGGGTESVPSLPSLQVTVRPGPAQKFTVSGQWTNPKLWTPDDPQLYILHTRLLDASAPPGTDNTPVLDEEWRRFGFRQISISSQSGIGFFTLNGVRVNLWGDSIILHAQLFNARDESQRLLRDQFMSRTTWPETIDKLKAMNIRTVRFHQAPAPPFVLDAADEKGLMITEESAIYARSDPDYFAPPTQRKGEPEEEFLRRQEEYKQHMRNYFAHCIPWARSWVMARRNHPSITFWNVENEMYFLGIVNTSEFADKIKLIGQNIRDIDPTRRIGYDGDEDKFSISADDPVNRHYPEHYGNTYPEQSIYFWGSDPGVAPVRDRPTGIGEFLTSFATQDDEEHRRRARRNLWWHGTLTRGLRYVGFTDLRPYRCQWAWADNTNPDAAANLRNSFAPVALFDYAYDDLGIDAIYSEGGGTPLKRPKLTAGYRETRRLVLYNDEFQITDVDVEILVRDKSTCYASGTDTFAVPLGNHIDIYYSFQVPFLQDQSVLEVVLRTYKAGENKFEEVKLFDIVNMGSIGTSSDVVTISLNPIMPDMESS